MKRPLFLMVMALALVIGAQPGEMNLAYGNDGPPNVTWYANSPSGLLPSGSNSGTPLRKFIDSLPGPSADGGVTGSADLWFPGKNNLGQYIPIAKTVPYPDLTCDYYQIGISEYTERVHTDLAKATKFRGYYDKGGAQPSHYLGPIIVAQKGRPVRVLFTNELPASNDPVNGNLFLPVDGTLMGAGTGPDLVTNYSQNRTSIHNHGAFTPWFSDGTPHQWFTPATEVGLNPYLKGVSLRNIPDMATPPAGSATLYYTNDQSARLMFYHDHAIGITRLNVYAGMAAGYLITDPVEQDLINGTNNTGVNPGLARVIPDNGGGAYTYGIPLIIQDKTFVPDDILTNQDTKWNQVPNFGAPGDLYYPHIYEANQNPNDPTGMNAYGRWDFGPWVQPNILAPTEPPPPVVQAVLPLPNGGTDPNWTPQNYATCTVPEAFNDVMMVNGTVYPFLVVQPKAYRFRILNASNDRFVNLQLYLDASGGGSGATATAVVDTLVGSITEGQIISVTVTNGGTGYVRAPGINITGGGGFGAYLTATVTGGAVTGITIDGPGAGYTSAPTLTIGDVREVKMVPAVPNLRYPSQPKDGRDGGVPDPTFAGPTFVQIGNECGLLPAPVAQPDDKPQFVAATATTPARLADKQQAVNFDYDRGSATFGNVQNLGGINGFTPPSNTINGVTILLGPAERADVIVDFSSVAPGTNVILYNDAPTPIPGFQPRYDYYTGGPDLTSTGGAPQTQVGVGPNTRTIMQFRVTGTPDPPKFPNQAAWDAFKTTLRAAYVASQPPPIVPQTVYPLYPGQLPVNTTQQFAQINAQRLTYTPVNSTTPTTRIFQQKAIVEIFEKYGRLSATLGLEFFDPLANPALSNGVGFEYIDPPDAVFRRPGETQLWKITHNGVDTHPIHIHLVNAQLINRCGWDGVIKPPEPNERGWKETIRMNPLESIFIAMKADLPKVPFRVSYSVRPLNPARPIGSTENFTNVNPKTGQNLNVIPTVNTYHNFGHEYVWHCHILAHEENDMMRPLVVYRTLDTGSMDLLLLD